MAWCDGMEESRLLIAPDLCTSNVRQETTTSANLEGSILSLCHPKSGTPTSYVFFDGFLQELNWFKQSHCSLFVGDYVCEDGSLYIATKVDPIFVLLPIFEEARMKKGNDKGMFRQLDEILYVDGYPGYQHLKSIAENSMHLVCEVKVKDIISILSEYLKEPWITSLCSHLQLDIEEDKRAFGSVLDSVFLESPPVSTPLQGKIEKGKQQMSSSGRQSKRLKIETDSKNIKDMFRRVTRKRA